MKTNNEPLSTLKRQIEETKGRVEAITGEPTIDFEELYQLAITGTFINEVVVYLYEDSADRLYLLNTCTRCGYRVDEPAENGFVETSWEFLDDQTDYSEIYEVESEDLASLEHTHVASWSVDAGVHDIDNPGPAARKFLGHKRGG